MRYVAHVLFSVDFSFRAQLSSSHDCVIRRLSPSGPSVLGTGNTYVAEYFQQKTSFNMLLYDGKSFFRSQKYHKLIYLWGSMPLK